MASPSLSITLVATSVASLSGSLDVGLILAVETVGATVINTRPSSVMIGVTIKTTP